MGIINNKRVTNFFGIWHRNHSLVGTNLTANRSAISTFIWQCSKTSADEVIYDFNSMEEKNSTRRPHKPVFSFFSVNVNFPFLQRKVFFCQPMEKRRRISGFIEAHQNTYENCISRLSSLPESRGQSESVRSSRDARAKASTCTWFNNTENNFLKNRRKLNEREKRRKKGKVSQFGWAAHCWAWSLSLRVTTAASWNALRVRFTWVLDTFFRLVIFMLFRA